MIADLALARALWLVVPGGLWACVATLFAPSPAAPSAPGGADRQVTAGVMGFALAAAAALAIEPRLRGGGGWRYNGDGGLLLGAPAELWIGVAILWGALPARLAGRGWWAVAAVVGVDAALWACLSGPPGSGALVEAASGLSLARTTLAACAATASAALARWTLEDRRVGLRAAAQGAWFWVMALDVLPAVAADALGEAPLQLGPVGVAVVLPWIALFAAAGRAFVTEGRGTLIPLDPPRRLVTTGPYAWIANPMQVAAVGAWLSLAALRGRWWLVGAAVVEVVYATGFAAGHEAEVLPRTLGPGWAVWRGGVRAWWPRWRGGAAGADDRR